MGAALEYLIDMSQRNWLFLEALRQRGNQYLEQMSQIAPNVLEFDFELVIDGRTLDRPVNYGLVRVRAPKCAPEDPKNRPFVVIDPRAGHGPGIAGFKAESEVGMAIEAGHPVYYVGFLPDPVPGQTIEDIALAEARFLEEVITLHPEADGKPFVIGNCQAGWAVMLVAAQRPELFGPILLAGTPLSYWAGVRGRNPMRYTGGLLGGTWLTALTSDLGNGKFDGAWLVANFESLNPANTLWTKHYNLWTKVDTEAPRYLEFEKWWTVHATLNAEEIQTIVDKLFVGNKLATAEMVNAQGVRIDLRNIESPIICFCSKGDNIAPPPQALGWILDLYEDIEDMRAEGQTIIYCVHESVGHLGIFVSGHVARKEHQEFAHNIDLVDCLPPGLYEAVIRPKTGREANPDLATGDFIVRFELRTLDDLRALVRNEPTEERKFASVARFSEINLGLYRAFIQPWVRSLVTAQSAEWLRTLHPLRLKYELFSDRNPWMRPVAQLAAEAREHRRPVSPDNPFMVMQELASHGITSMLETYGLLRDHVQEQVFHAVYGSPLVQALAGLAAGEGSPRRRPGIEPEELSFMEQRIAEVRERIPEGGLGEAVIRAMIYIILRDAVVDERGFAVLRRVRAEYTGLTLARFKQILREQYAILLLDEEGAVKAVSAMLPDDLEPRLTALSHIREIVLAAGEPSQERRRRLARITDLFDDLALSERKRSLATP
ncbi:MAG: DUF3141 domain-containing protein [Methylococcaceae bacterium]|nr:DUF3141 domain-containing protein [Methylococcaceae bacterium]